MKLNIGCGKDYRKGFTNRDACRELNPDICLEVPSDDIFKYVNRGSCDYILLQDVLEHLFLWQAETLISHCSELLSAGGILEIRVPDFEHIIKSLKSTEYKLRYLYGGQHIAAEGESEESAEVRKANPEYFCHKSGWSLKSLKALLKKNMVLRWAGYPEE